MRVGKRIRLNTIVYEAQEIKNQVRHLSPIAAKAPSKLFSCLQQCLKWLANSVEKGNALHRLPHIWKCLQVWQSKPIIQIAEEFTPFFFISWCSQPCQNPVKLFFYFWFDNRRKFDCRCWVPLSPIANATPQSIISATPGFRGPEATHMRAISNKFELV